MNADGAKVVEYITDQIAKGTWKQGEKIATIRELVRLCEVSEYAASLGVNALVTRRVLRRNRSMGRAIVN